MPAPLLAFAPAAISAASTAFSLMNKAKNKPSTNMHQYARLKSVQQDGYYTPEVRSRILGETSRNLGAFAQRNQASTKGELARIGAGGSIAGVKALGQAGRDYAQGVQEQSSRMSLEDAAIRNKASDALAALRDESENERRAYKTDFRNTALQGLTNTFSLATQGMKDYDYQQSVAKLLEDNEPMMDKIKASGDMDAYRSLVQQLYFLAEKAGL